MSAKKISVFIVVLVLHAFALGLVYLSTRKDDTTEIQPQPVDSVNNESENNTGNSPAVDKPVENTNIKPQENSLSSDYVVHTVMKGEYLGKIAAKYKVSVQAIMDLNEIDDQNKILPGRELKIPKSND